MKILILLKIEKHKKKLNKQNNNNNNNNSKNNNNNNHNNNVNPQKKRLTVELGANVPIKEFQESQMRYIPSAMN